MAQLRHFGSHCVLDADCMVGEDVGAAVTAELQRCTSFVMLLTPSYAAELLERKTWTCRVVRAMLACPQAQLRFVDVHLNNKNNNRRLTQQDSETGP